MTYSLYVVDLNSYLSSFVKMVIFQFHILQCMSKNTFLSLSFIQLCFCSPSSSSIAIPAYFFFPLCCSLKILISWSLSCYSSEPQGPSFWWKYLRSLWVFTYAWVWHVFSLAFRSQCVAFAPASHASPSAFAASTFSFSPPKAWITVVSWVVGSSNCWVVCCHTDTCGLGLLLSALTTLP